MRLLLAAALCLTAVSPSTVDAQLPGAAVPDERWPVKSREHIDLWLHGFAMISADSSPVPLFRRGYRERMDTARKTANAVTDLDANRDALARRVRGDPSLVNAQFVPLSFADWPELDEAIEAFLKANGDPRAASREAAGTVARLAAAFPSSDGRDFARRLMISLRSERERFYHQWWVDETRRRDRTLAAVDSLWQRVYRPTMQQFLDHTQQGDGDVILVIALEGEGRTVSAGKRRNVVAIGFPESPAEAIEAIYELAHEFVGPLAGAAVDDNTTPAEKRSGAAARLSGLALVRGGALLLGRAAPALVPGYARFYLHAAGISFEGDPMVALEKAFPLPPALLDSMSGQIAVAFGGI